MKFLEEISYHLPLDKKFSDDFFQFLAPLGMQEENKFILNKSNKEFSPNTSFIFTTTNVPFVLFTFSDSSSIRIDIINETSEKRQSPHSYSPIEFSDFLERMKKYHPIGLDHTGFNLPYFDGIHPKILKLREQLKEACMYHTFPKHLEDAPWDFIIPGTKEEIQREIPVDYMKTRKPKLEIVSFDKASTPLIQIDLQIQETYEEFSKDFPEGILVPEIKCVWVYIKNSFGIDICMVVNQAGEGDWSYQFAKERIV